MSPFRFLSLIALGACLAYSSGSAYAGSITLEPVKDNTLYQPIGDEVNSNGLGDYMFAGNPAHGSSRRGVMQFDIAGTIPPGATIDSVSLQMHMSRTLAGPATVTLHRLLADWGEGTSNGPNNEGLGAEATVGDATWFDRFHPTTPWASNGGDYDAPSVASQTVADVASYTWNSTSAFVQLVQDWLDNPAANFGMIVVGDEEQIPSAKRFNSRHFPVSNQRPRLIIAFTESDCMDSDQDGYGDPGSDSCPNGAEEDCNDDNENINPGAVEICDGVDNNCNDQTDEGLSCAVPTVSAWGMGVMLLVLLVGATLVFTPRNAGIHVR